MRYGMHNYAVPIYQASACKEALVNVLKFTAKQTKIPYSPYYKQLVPTMIFKSLFSALPPPKLL